MVSDDSTATMLAPLEAHVGAQVKHLTAVAGVVQELQAVEEQYAKEFAELPFDVSADATTTLERLPPLRTVCDDFSLFVRKCSVVKADAAKDLTKEVIAPLEVFTTEHVEKAQHLLSELYELLQREKAFDVAYENLLESCEKDQTQEKSAEIESTSPAQDQSELQLHQTHMEQLLRKRDAERLAIQQWITALHFAGQRYEAHVRDVLRRTLSVYSRMITSLTALVGELQGQLTRDTSGANVAVRASGSNNSSAASEESWESFMAGYDCHVAITCWMSELFKQMIPVEQNTAKRLQKVVKLDRAVTKAFGGVEFSSRLSGLIGFHGLLTVNIADPIMRTLKFSRERQERMRKELSKSLEETGALVVNAQARLDAKLKSSKEQTEEKSPVRRDSMTSSETSECGVDDNNEHEHKGSDVTPLEEVLVKTTPEQVRLETAERKLELQRQEMARVLEQTSYLSVKTMELMVQDHIKHVIKALTALAETTQKEITATQRSGPETASQPWDHITEKLSIGVSDHPVFQDEKSQQNERHCSQIHAASHRMIHRRRDIRTVARSVNEPSVIQVALSFAQSAVGILGWAAAIGFKTAKSHMPHSMEERVVLAAIVVMIFAMISVCMRSSQLHHSWGDLTNTQQLNSEVVAQVVKLSLDVCRR
ncbi:uncharacterized protein KRP23_6679 [Phytophthora ramorum]|uniref:Uncharacterized protein n=1 Tax=Phytophthora ramorum TaxID=164328 RepID=H3GHU3_PHYRM|nr:hypothetical protein KRP23_6679 [Phytophthora ramorum]